MDDNFGHASPSQVPAAPGFPPPPPPSQGWPASQVPPPPPPPPAQWGAAPAPRMTPVQRRRVWDMVSLGFGAGSLWAGIAGLAASGLALLMIRAPIQSTHTGVQGTVDHAVGRFLLVLIGMMLAVTGIGAGGLGGVAGVVGLVTRRASIAALSILGVAAGVGGILLGIYALGQIGS